MLAKAIEAAERKALDDTRAGRSAEELFTAAVNHRYVRPRATQPAYLMVWEVAKTRADLAASRAFADERFELLLHADRYDEGFAVAISKDARGRLLARRMFADTDTCSDHVIESIDAKNAVVTASCRAGSCGPSPVFVKTRFTVEVTPALAVHEERVEEIPACESGGE